MEVESEPKTEANGVPIVNGEGNAENTSTKMQPAEIVKPSSTTEKRFDINQRLEF